MIQLITAAFIAFCGFLDACLRIIPFFGKATAQEKKKVFVSYAVLLTAYTGIILWLLHFLSMTAAIRCLQVGSNVFALVTFIPNVLIFKGKLREHIFILGIIATLQYLMLSIPAYVVSFFSEYTPFWQMVILFASYGVLLVLTFFPMRKLVKETLEPFLTLDTGDYWNTVFFVPMAFFLGMMFLLWGTETTNSFMQMVSSMCSGTMMIGMCLSIAADNKHIAQRQYMEKQLEAQKNHYTELKVRVEDARKTKHDFKHHIAAIRHYTECDDKAGLQSYCDDLVGRFERGAIPYTGNVVADGVLYHYMQQASLEQIDFSYAGTIQSQGIADVDICVLLGNALDNALTACKTIRSKRSISVICQSEEHMLSVVVRNTFDGKVLTSDKGLLSRKRENRPGVGLASMRSICDRYGGTMDTTWDEDSFTVCFVLPKTEQ